MEKEKKDLTAVWEIPKEALKDGWKDKCGFLWVNDDGKRYDNLDFYDPDGYFFKDGTDEFGGYYDDNLEYIPAEETKENLKD